MNSKNKKNTNTGAERNNVESRRSNESNQRRNEEGTMARDSVPMCDLSEIEDVTVLTDPITDLCDWLLHDIGMPQYVQLFKESSIRSVGMLSDSNWTDLKEIGILNPVHRSHLIVMAQRAFMD